MKLPPWSPSQIEFSQEHSESFPIGWNWKHRIASHPRPLTSDSLYEGFRKCNVELAWFASLASREAITAPPIGGVGALALFSGGAGIR